MTTTITDFIGLLCTRLSGTAISKYYDDGVPVPGEDGIRYIVDANQEAVVIRFQSARGAKVRVRATLGSIEFFINDEYVAGGHFFGGPPLLAPTDLGCGIPRLLEITEDIYSAVGRYVAAIDTASEARQRLIDSI
jgi:hypothetical protein